MSMDQRSRVADVAVDVCMRYAKGHRGAYTIGNVTFDLRDRGYCARFVRECHEAVLGTGEHSWKYRGADAREIEHRLIGAGKEVEQPHRGDIVCFNKDAGKYGHIGIYLGPTLFAENTSSKSRGPGFVLSPLYGMLPRVSGFYSVMPGVSAFLMPGSIEISCNLSVDDYGQTWCDFRKLVEMLGGEVQWFGHHATGIYEGQELSGEVCGTTFAQTDENTITTRCLLRKTAEAMGYRVDYDETKMQIMISKE